MFTFYEKKIEYLYSRLRADLLAILNINGKAKQEKLNASLKAADNNIFIAINITIARYLSDVKNIIDSLIGKDNKKKVQEFFENLFL